MATRSRSCPPLPGAETPAGHAGRSRLDVAAPIGHACSMVGSRRRAGTALVTAALSLGLAACGGQDQSSLSGKVNEGNRAHHDAGRLGTGVGVPSDGVNDDQGGSQAGKYLSGR